MMDQPMKPLRLFEVLTGNLPTKEVRRKATAEEEVQDEAVLWQWRENGQPSPAK